MVLHFSGWGEGCVLTEGLARLLGPGARDWQTMQDWCWKEHAVSSTSTLGSGGEVERYIFLIIELCTHYETIIEPKYIKFQIANTSLYKGVIK